MLRKDLTGLRFGKLVILRFTGRNKYGMANWECQCDCGKILVVCGNNLSKGNTRACGCLRKAWNKGKKGMQVAWNKGKICPQLSAMQMGAKNPQWKGGVTPERKKMYYSEEYKAWRRWVFERDNYTCVCCGQRGGILHADHIKPYANYPELRLDKNNGRTLCIGCHKKTDTYGGASKRKVTKLGIAAT